jgi:hypothetical protein
MQKFTTQFTLSREYLAECYDQSLPHGKNPKPNYMFPAILALAGGGIVAFTDQPAVTGLMLIGLAILELVHIRFRRSWWLARQMLGRSSGSEVTLTIDDSGIETVNPYTKTALLWSDVTQVIETELGLILVAKNGGQQYLSKSLFSAPLIAEILAVSDANVSKP